MPQSAYILLSLLICATSLAADPSRIATVICVDESAEPISGAEVYAIFSMWDGKGIQKLELGLQVSGADGVCRFTVPPASSESAGSLSVYARVPGKLAGIAHQEPLLVGGRPLEEPFKLILHPAETLTGQVTAPVNVKLDKLLVQLMAMSIVTDPTRPEHFRRSMTLGDQAPWAKVFEYPVNAAGTILIPDIPKGANVSLVVGGPGVAFAPLQRPRGGDVGTKFEAKLVEESIIEGTVKSDGDAPLANLVISAVHDRDPSYDHSLQFSYRAATDQEGHFRFAGLRQGIYNIAVLELPEGWTTLPQRVRVERGQVATAGLHLQRGVIVQGTVADAATDRPLPGATIAVNSVHEWGAHLVGRSAPTDAEGRFSVRAPVGVVSLHVFRKPKGYGPTEAVELVIPADAHELEDVHFKLGPAKPNRDLARISAPKGTIRGRVVDPQGRSVPGVRYSVKMINPTDPRQFVMAFSNVTNEDGAYSQAFLEAGTEYVVEVPLWSTTGAESDPVIVKANETVELDDLVVTPRERISEIAGVVLTSEERPISGALLMLGDVASVQTGDDGQFRLDLYEETAPTLRVMADPFEHITIDDVVAGTTDLRIVLQPRDPLKPSR